MQATTNAIACFERNGLMVVVAVVQSQSLKGEFLPNHLDGVLIGKKHDEISSINQNDLRERRGILGSIPKDAYRTNERSND